MVDFLSSTQLYNIDNDETTNYVDLPVTTDVHVMLKLNESHFFTCCGHHMSGSSYIFDMSTETWTEVPRSEYDHDSGFAGKIVVHTTAHICQYKMIVGVYF